MSYSQVIEINTFNKPYAHDVEWWRAENSDPSIS